MRQIHGVRSNGVRPALDLFQTCMDEVRLATETSNDPDFDAFERAESFRVQTDDVSRIRDIANAHADGAANAVVLFENSDIGAANPDISWRHWIGAQARAKPAAAVGFREDICKSTGDLIQMLAEPKRWNLLSIKLPTQIRYLLELSSKTALEMTVDNVGQDFKW